MGEGGGVGWGGVWCIRWGGEFHIIYGDGCQNFSKDPLKEVQYKWLAF